VCDILDSVKKSTAEVNKIARIIQGSVIADPLYFYIFLSRKMNYNSIFILCMKHTCWSGGNCKIAGYK
jgi:hypothetical protein